jgi:hypothetical protein
MSDTKIYKVPVRVSYWAYVHQEADSPKEAHDKTAIKSFEKLPEPVNNGEVNCRPASVKTIEQFNP